MDVQEGRILRKEEHQGRKDIKEGRVLRKEEYQGRKDIKEGGILREEKNIKVGWILRKDTKEGY